MVKEYGAGKGDTYRKVDQKKYAKNWKKAFNTKSIVNKGVIDKSGISTEKENKNE